MVGFHRVKLKAAQALASCSRLEVGATCAALHRLCAEPRSAACLGKCLFQASWRLSVLQLGPMAYG